MIISKSKISIILCVLAFFFASPSCKTEPPSEVISISTKKSSDIPENYLNALDNKIEQFITLAAKAGADKTIDSQEANDLNKLKKNIIEFQYEIDKNLKNDSDGKLKIENFYQQNCDLIARYNEATNGLKTCKGSDKLQF